MGLFDCLSNHHSDSEEDPSYSEEGPFTEEEGDDDSYASSEEGDYEFPAEHNLNNVQYSAIPIDYPVGGAVMILKHYLDEYEMEELPMTWYINTHVRLEELVEPLPDHLEAIFTNWNERHAQASMSLDSEEEADEDAEMDSVQLYVYRKNNAYELYLEHISEGNPLNCETYSISEEDIGKVLKAFCVANNIYDRYEKKVYYSA